MERSFIKTRTLRSTRFNQHFAPMSATPVTPYSVLLLEHHSHVVRIRSTPRVLSVVSAKVMCTESITQYISKCTYLNIWFVYQHIDICTSTSI